MLNRIVVLRGKKRFVLFFLSEPYKKPRVKKNKKKPSTGWRGSQPEAGKKKH
jgi:hypothetical protein